MKPVTLLVTSIVLAAALSHATTYSRNATPTSGLWNDGANWTPSGYPQLQGDEADFTLIAATTTQVDDDGRFSTTSVIRASLSSAGAVTLSRQLAVGNSDNLVLLSNVSGYAHVVMLSGTTSSTSPLNLNDTLRVEAAHPVIISNAYSNTGRPIVLACDFFGAGDIICQGVGPIRFGFTAVGCEESIYSGTIYVREMSSNGRATFYGNSRAFTNSPDAKIVVQNTGVLAVDQANSRCNLPMTLLSGSRLTCNNTPDYASNVTVNGDVMIEAGGATAVLTLDGTVNGTGTVARSGSGNGTVRYTGTIAPGFSAGALVLNENVGTLQLGIAGDPVLLSIEDGDVISNINMGAAVDLANIDVVFTTPTALGTTNWFLHADSGFVNDFNSTNYGAYVGYQVYEANRIGAVVVPEPVVAGLGAVLLLFSRRRRIA